MIKIFKFLTFIFLKLKMIMKVKVYILMFLLAVGCQSVEIVDEKPSPENPPFVWENASVYFLLTDRFYNGDPANDQSFNRKKDGAVLRGFEGGDLKGITLKIKDGYFDKLGITAIWFTPPFEQITSFTDEGTGKTYAYHGYWIRDWTSIDPNYGTGEDLQELVDIAHEHGIRILMDAVLNHTGPVTNIDTQWPDDWVRTGPRCTYQDMQTAITCTLVENLPDIKTESNEEVDLPDFLVEKWRTEGRLDQEMQELDEFFTRTHFPRAPRYYIIKWLVDWIRAYGIDGFRVDTAKHTEASVWEELLAEAIAALNEWKEENPDKKPDDLEFFMTGEVYGYSINNGRIFDYGNKETIDFFANGFQNLINFSFIHDIKKPTEELFSSYSNMLTTGDLKGLGVLNYLSSHDDGNPFDPERTKVFEAGTKLLLTPGTAQIYYGDEIARPLIIEGTEGDATLRSFMNWEDLDKNTDKNGYSTQDVLSHWSKLGTFRKEHISVGAGTHTKLQDSPYIFKREFDQNGFKDKVLVVMYLPTNESQIINVYDVFPDGTLVKDYYSGTIREVIDGKVNFDTNMEMLLIGEPFE